ncbi:uncharacterized protein LOC122757201 [Drosophila mojavensis]|uniref:uncharacterized protein LOC122757201 n=1 Tax=Drosophila mojavensis TaxID=7230 RepID=UPI001CD0DB05|nr:uncharacterized protein LOC122757201 [Drosophila mojavensis]
MAHFSMPRDNELRKEFPVCVDPMSNKYYEMGIVEKKRQHFKDYVEPVDNKFTNLISFEYGVPLIKGLPYEKVLQLKTLKHLYIWIDSSLKYEFLVALGNKSGETIESLSIKGAYLTTEHVERICDTLQLSLENFCVWCKEVPLEHLLKLQKLKSLHIQMSSIKNAMVMELIKGLPNLVILNMRECQLLTEEFVSEALDCLTNNNKQSKLTIYVQGSAINWKELPGNGHLLQVIEKQKNEIVRMNGELSNQYN